MNRTIKVAAVLSIAGVLALSGCGDDSDGGSDGGGTTINVVGYSVLEQANKGVISAFEKTDAGKDVTFKESYGASGDQSRAVVNGQKADVVHLSLEPDVTRLVDEGLVADDWKDNDTKGICTNSVVVFVVQKGNPKGIESWDDLIQDGVGIVTPNPASSGSAKWNLLAAYGAAKDEGGSDEAALDYMTKFFGNVAALPDSGRDATTAFTERHRRRAPLLRERGDPRPPERPGLRLRDPGRDPLHRQRVRGHRRTRRRRPRTSWTSRRARTARSCTPRPATAR